MQQKRKNISNFPGLLHRLETSCSASEATHKEAGFTLIEVIVTMLIAGILATIAGLGIVQGVKGYVFASENAAITQKVELAMSRMSLELRDISEVTVASETKIEYKCAGEPEVEHTIELVGSKITLDTDDLVDKVSGFEMTYKEADGTTSWIVGNPPKDLARVNIELKLKHTETEDEDIPDITFTTTINPRNTF